MPITLHDRAPLEKVRRLADGRIAAVAKFARSGCYQYAGHELGRPDLPTVTVFRPEEEVFSADAMASFAHKAITLDHPAGSVTAGNWSKVAVGFTEGRVARDGGYIEIPLMLADASAVAAFDAGTRQLSAGYSCELVWGDGIAPTGERFQAKQVTIRGDHIALVREGRAGPEARIGDSMSHNVNDAEIARDVAYARMVHNQQFAYMGDRAPAFNEAGAEAAARARGGSGQKPAASTPVTDQAATDAAYSTMCNDLRDAWRRDRNARVTNAYRG